MNGSTRTSSGCCRTPKLRLAGKLGHRDGFAPPAETLYLAQPVPGSGPQPGGDLLGGIDQRPDPRGSYSSRVRTTAR
jgi:hypothetical protein